LLLLLPALWVRSELLHCSNPLVLARCKGVQTAMLLLLLASLLVWQLQAKRSTHKDTAACTHQLACASCSMNG
jgi:hypothetical protein